MHYDDFRLDFNNDHLELAGRNGWQEAICPICDEQIRWCLDMFTFTAGFPHLLAHARCVWTPEAFDHQKHLSQQRDAIT